MFYRLFVFILLGCLLEARGQAAVIEWDAAEAVGIITIAGRIERGDFDKFKDIVRRLPPQQKVVVGLNSRGGSVGDGLAIGALIRARRYWTFVPDDADCASVCGLIWLGGVKHFVGEKGNIGFHAAYTKDGDEARESGVANALVGAYLNELGLSLDAIAYITSASPTEMQWLTPQDARRIGIDFVVLPTEPRRQRRNPYPFMLSPPPSSPPLTDGPAPVPSPYSPPSPSLSGTAQEQRAMSVVLGYYALWSEATTNVDALTAYYAERVHYYGGFTSRAKVMDDKQKFSLRWPIRKYAIRPGSLSAQCADTCSVSAIVEWDTKSYERNDHSVGSANILLKIVLNGSPTGGVIVSESGGVIVVKKEPLQPPRPAAPAPATTPSDDAGATAGFAAGRQARTEWEQWVSTLPDGPYRDGALFWAGNRSAKVPPICASATPDWQRGCEDARKRLSYPDTRRRAEKDFRLGWNSL